MNLLMLFYLSLLILITIWNDHDSFKLLEMTLLMEFREIALFLLVMLLNLSHYTISLKVVTNIGAYLFLLVVGLGRNVETRHPPGTIKKSDVKIQRLYENVT